MTSAAPIRVVVADDSALMRRIVASSLAQAGIQTVGSAANGDEALATCERERPDALMLDLSMPGLDGIGVLRALRRQGRSTMPVIVVSAFSPSQGARAVDALAEGAFDLVAKPAVGESLDEFAAALVTKVRAATAARRGQAASNGASAGCGTQGAVPSADAPSADAPPADVAQADVPQAAAPRASKAPRAIQQTGAAQPGLPGAARPMRSRTRISRAVVIATSTGGPRALATLVPRLPARLGMGTLIVQHMPPGFTRSLAARLDQASELNVREADGGELLDPGVALLAPGGKHLRLGTGGRVSLSDEPEVGALRPRADLTIGDAARIFGERTLLVVMTGMGNDGLAGAQEIRRRGGRVIVEAESTCTVYGMPRAVLEAKLADAVLPLHKLAEAISQEAAA